MGLDSSKHVYRAYNNELKASREGMALAAETKKMDDNLPGNMAADFTAKDMNGNTVSLADHKGKYVLLDFWASWNTTSRKNNPHLLELYHKYNAKGLDIIAIANNDASTEGWKVAVNKDETCIWPNLLSGVGTENDLNDKYAIHFTPTKVLIDPTGKIIGRFGDNYNQDLGMDRLLENIFRKIDEDIKKAKDAETQASIVIK
jgi:peroxiredoxin